MQCLCKHSLMVSSGQRVGGFFIMCFFLCQPICNQRTIIALLTQFRQHRVQATSLSAHRGRQPSRRTWPANGTRWELMNQVSICHRHFPPFMICPLLTLILVCSWLRHCENYVSPNLIYHFCVCLGAVINKLKVL